MKTPIDCLNKPSQARRRFLKLSSSALLAASTSSFIKPSWAAQVSPGFTHSLASTNHYELEIGYRDYQINGETSRATAINGSVPGPLVRIKEGEHVNLTVRNTLDVYSSIHWHGLLVPADMDGVPGLSFNGIAPGEEYHYHFPVKQAGTYWYHSHSGFQEQSGTYGPLIIDPIEPEPFNYQREHVIVLSDWSPLDPHSIFNHIRGSGDYYNFQRRTVTEYAETMAKNGVGETLDEVIPWQQMRMSPVDISDVTGALYTYLVNGHSPEMNWTGLFQPGEIIRLRVINGSAMSVFDVRIPGVDMQVVMIDGQKIQPVACHEFRIGTAETVDVLVTLNEDRAYTFFAEANDRSDHAVATLAPRAGMRGEIPERRPRPVRTLDEIGMGMMKGGGSHNMSMDMDMSEGGMHHHGGDMKASGMPDDGYDYGQGPLPFKTSAFNAQVAMLNPHTRSRLAEPGLGLGNDGWKVLTYADLRSNEPQPYSSTVEREMTVNLTANMERYLFSFDGLSYADQPGPYIMKLGERLRLWLVNHTMMAHPIHLHGMWMQLENGASRESLPYKHTILVKPGERVSALITPVEKGDWAFHCHFLYHMDAGMFQVVRVV